MKILRFLLVAYLLVNRASFAFAETVQCSTNGYTIATINGVLTNSQGAIENMVALSKKVGFSAHNQEIKYQYLLNPSHIGGIGDLAMVAYQKVLENETVQDYDLLEILNSASQKVKTQKLLLVPHSQGNFYANSFYDTIADKDGGVPRQSIGIYSVANPADRVAGGGKWLTSDTDRVIAWYVGHVPGKNIMPTNITIPEVAGGWDPLAGHDFSNVYLRYQGPRIVSDIKQSLIGLSSDPERREDLPCIDPPKLSVGHKIEGAVLSVLDHPLDTTVGAADNGARSIYATTIFASNVGNTIASTLWNGSVFVMQTTARIAVAASSSIFAAIKSIASNPGSGITSSNNASTILAVTPPAVSPQTTQLPPLPQQNSTVNPTTPVKIGFNANSADISTSIISPVIIDGKKMLAVTPGTPFPKIAPAPGAPIARIDLGDGRAPTKEKEVKGAELSAATTVSGSDLGGGAPPQEKAKAAEVEVATTTPEVATTTPEIATSTPEKQTIRKPLYSHPYIGNAADVSGGWSTSSGVNFYSENRTEDAYSVRVKKSSDFDCNTDLVYGFISSGSGPFSYIVVSLDTLKAKTEGLYCEYPFTDTQTFIRADIALQRIYFIATHNGAPAFLDGSFANNSSTEGSDGIWRPATTFAFQLCGIDGCNEKFVLPPDGVNLSTPTRQTYLYSPTFSGTYNNNAILNIQETYSNNATFNKIVFEFKNTTLDIATSTVARDVQTIGSVIPYSEQIDIPSAGEWQYRTRLEDTVNASSTPWTQLAYFTYSPRTTENRSEAKTVFANQYIGTSIDVGTSSWTNNRATIFYNQSRPKDVYSVRVKKVSDFNCQTDVGAGFLTAGSYSAAQRVVTFDIAHATTDGSYCEYPFTEESTSIRADLALIMISFSTTQNIPHALLDGSLANGASTMNAGGIWLATPTYAFQLCNLYGCDGKFIYPPDGVTLTTPTNQTYLYSPTFSGTYNNNAILNTQETYINNATFNKIVFEFKNTTLDIATSTVARDVPTIGSIIPYLEQIDIPSAGDWQYRTRLEDTVNASSTPWTQLAYFTYSPRTAENQIKARTAYANLYIGTPVELGGYWSSNNGVAFINEKRNEDAYSIRVKKASDFDCRTDVRSGYISYTWNGTYASRIVYFDPSTATTDGTYCEYTFTEDRTALSLNSSIDAIYFSVMSNEAHVRFDGAVSNDGRARNGYGIDPDAASYAFQLCNLYGCDGTFILPSDGTTSTATPPPPVPVLSSVHTITAFNISVATSTISGVIDETAHTVDLTIPFGTDAHALVPTVAVSLLATSSPASGIAQDFTTPVIYTVTAQDGSTQTYTVKVTIAVNPTPLTILPTITSYTFNGVESDVTTEFSTTTQPVDLKLTASKNVDWVSITLEDENNPTNYKRFFSGAGCVDGTDTCVKSWDGVLSHGTSTLSNAYRVKVNIKDAEGNRYHDYLTPYRIIAKKIASVE